MGYAVAAQAAKRGHDVTLVTGPVEVKPPTGVNIVRVTTAAEMSSACKRAFRDADVAVMTAAVCDYRPAKREPRKLAKTGKHKRVLFEPTEDIASALGRRKAHRLLIGFAMEDADEPRALAERKLKRKRCDLIVLNGPENVASNRATVEWFTPANGWSEAIEGTKTAVARQLVKLIESMLAEKQ
jgi:phosphopantothenoylcysteine decarboxylase/phosphopantothenate--cysteine ligase